MSTPSENLSRLDRANRERADWIHNIRPFVVDEERPLSSVLDPGKRNPISLSEYRVRSLIGQVQATEYLAEQVASDTPSVDEIQEAHRRMFTDVTRDMGQLRLPHQIAMSNGHLAAESPRIPLEMTMLSAQTREILAASDTAEQKVVAMAFYNAGFLARKPFRDGNARVARCILAASAERHFGSSAPLLEGLAENHSQYLNGLACAQDQNDLGPLARAIGQQVGITLPEGRIPSPFGVRPRPMMAIDDIGPLEREMEQSRTGAAVPKMLLSGPDMDV